MERIEKNELSKKTYNRILKFQKDEITGSILYRKIAKRVKNEHNKKILLEIADAEIDHYNIWREFTKKDVKPEKFKIFIMRLVCFFFGYTFTVRFFEKREEFGIKGLRLIENDIPEAKKIIDDEEEHEERLMELIDEERLHFIGAMVLGLNDALVELTGAIAGLTFALADTKLIILSAIITGVSATLSMAASNYLSEKADGNKNALKSSVYTGLAYLITVALMIIPYLVIPNVHIAFGVMLGVVLLIIIVFNFYVSVTKNVSFWKRFMQMALISFGVAAISFGIGMLAKNILGVEI